MRRSDSVTLTPKRLRVKLRAAAYAVRGGFLVRPFIIALALGGAGAVLSWAEEQTPVLGALVPEVLFPSHADPQVAQAILTDIATSIMTVVSIVFAILLMTLTLASTQFSPRILISFVRDRVTQWTLGVFLGTFSYCVAALPAVRSAPAIFVPVATVTGAMLLAPVCVGWLIYFIHHISNAISVNHIVDRIRRETEQVIDALMPEPRRPNGVAQRPDQAPETDELLLVNRQSGYIRFADIQRLVALARAYRVRVRLQRRVGHFVPEGVPLLRISHAERMSEEGIGALLAAVDLGPTRTMQQDVEFGIVQIVDIALRALSPAVNDPSTAISCVDQLSCILIRWAARAAPPNHYYEPRDVLRLTVPWIGFDGLLDLAFQQIRHYAAADAAVSLRLMRALGDIASTITDAELRNSLVERGRSVVEGCTGRLEDGDLRRLLGRFALLESCVAEEVV
jgi:uncharacterized membrane protein